MIIIKKNCILHWNIILYKPVTCIVENSIMNVLKTSKSNIYLIE